MKKLLVLALVLSMATMASAALQITVGGAAVNEITVLPSDNLVLGIASDALIGFGKGDWNGSALVANVPGATLDASMAVSLQPNEPGIAIFQNAAVDLGFVVPTYPGSDGPGFTFTFTGADVAAGMLIDQIAFHCNGPGTVTLQLWGSQDYATFEVLDTVVITQLIPEPMTMGLLGLGGLFLRRRK